MKELIINENFIKKFTDKTIIIIDTTINEFNFCFLKFSKRYENISKLAIAGINWGFGELIKKIVIGVNRIIYKKKSFKFFFILTLPNKGISAKSEENWISAPNCSAPSANPNAIIISPTPTSFSSKGSKSKLKLPLYNILIAPYVW